MTRCKRPGFRRRLAKLALLASLIGLPLPASAWNAAGHRLSAIIAWRALDEATRQAIGTILAQHPDHGRWIAHQRDETPELAAFIEASTWPDDIKTDKRFYDAERDRPTTLLAGFPDMARHRHWHYIDRPLGPPPERNDTDGELDRQLDRLSSTLRDPVAGALQRAYALPWLIHLVADAHQPLHVVSHYDATGKGDRGGNLLTVRNPFHRRPSSISLHRYWDDLAGPPWLHGRDLAEAASAIVAAHPPPPHAGGATRWIDESWKIARDSAYPPEDGTMPTLTADFHAKAQEIAHQRIAEAGYRIAALLRKLLGSRR